MSFERPKVFWLGAVACVAGVLLHLPMYFMARDMHYRLSGMKPDAPMVIGMVLIVGGLIAVFLGLLPSGSRRRALEGAARYRVTTLDDAPLNRAHAVLAVVMAVAVTIDVMKPTSLAFVVPGFAKEYGLKAPNNPHGHTPASWLPLVGITGTVLGSWLWGSLGDWMGRRAAITFAGMLFITTSVCAVMPGFTWNLLMCLLMGIGAGGMLPITFTLLAETVPTRHRGWLMVVIGGNVAVAYVATSWLAARLIPDYSWRVMWLIGLPTGLLFLALNHFIPESPRFLLARGRDEQAREVMERYGARVEEVETPAAAQSAQRGGWGLLVRGALAGPTIALVILGLGIGLTTYGFQLWIPTNLQHLGYSSSASAYVVRNAALIGLPLTALMAWMYGVWGARASIVTTTVVTAGSLIAFAVAGNSLVDHRILLSALLIAPLSGLNTVVAMVAGYAAEVYPTRVRARGTGLAAGMTKLGGVLVLAVAVGSATVPGIAVTALMGALPLLLAAAVFFRVGPETRSRRLEDISRDLGVVAADAGA